jgi:predicted nucleotidyltransferase
VNHAFRAGEVGKDTAKTTPAGFGRKSVCVGKRFERKKRSAKPGCAIYGFTTWDDNRCFALYVQAMVKMQRKQDLAEQVLEVLRVYAPALKRRGVKHAVLFGSVARGTQIPESDVDIALLTGERAAIGLFDIVEMERELTSKVGREVHLTVMRETRRSPVREVIDREGLLAF